jgi:GDP-L-fucose synthase
MKILITGGNGYIAKNLYLQLSSKYNITRVTRNDFDLTDTASTCSWFDNKTFNVIIHTAAVGGSRLKIDQTDIVYQNFKMLHNLQANKQSFNKLITFGSGAEIFAPDSPYGLSKIQIAKSIEETDNFYNLRIFGVFNHNELDTRFIKGNILRYIKHEPMVLHSNKVMDFYYMDDLVSLVDYYITQDNLIKTANCSYKEKYTLQNIADFINTLDNHRVSATIQTEQDLQFYCGNPHGLPIEEIGLKQGIINTYNQLRTLYNDSDINERRD